MSYWNEKMGKGAGRQRRVVKRLRAQIRQRLFDQEVEQLLGNSSGMSRSLAREVVMRRHEENHLRAQYYARKGL